MCESLAHGDHAAALAMLAAHYQAMPPVAALHLQVAGYDDGCLRLRAPLQAHVNDKGCAFGGSLVSLMTLAGWGLVTLRLAAAGLRAEVFVADSQVRYLAPLFADLDARARLAPDAHWDACIGDLRARGRASVPVEAWVASPDGGIACRASARFVAIAKG